VEEDGLPEGLGEPPLGLVGLHGELLAGEGVEEDVVDDAVVGRVEPGDDGVVVGEGEGGKDRDESGLGLGAVFYQTLDVGSGGLELVPESEAVGGNEDHHRVGELGAWRRQRRRRRRWGGEVEGENEGCEEEHGGDQEENAGSESGGRRVSAGEERG